MSKASEFLNGLAIFQEWKRLVGNHAVSGVQVHDARIVAAMKVHGVDHLITFNGSDFRRYQGISILDPRDIVSEYDRQPQPP